MVTESKQANSLGQHRATCSKVLDDIRGKSCRGETRNRGDYGGSAPIRQIIRQDAGNDRHLVIESSTCLAAKPFSALDLELPIEAT